jgi:hypothetical protein
MLIAKSVKMLSPMNCYAYVKSALDFTSKGGWLWDGRFASADARLKDMERKLEQGQYRHLLQKLSPRSGVGSCHVQQCASINRDGLPLCFSVPEADFEMFQQRIGKEGVNWLRDEDVIRANPALNLDVYCALPGHISPLIASSMI